MKRTIKAFLLSPIIVPVTVAFTLGSNFDLGGAIFGPEDSVMTAIIIIGLPITYFLVSILGLPVHAWLRDSQLLTNKTSFAAGFITSYFLFFSITFVYDWGIDLKWILVCLIIGLGGGVGSLLYGIISGDIARITNRSTTDASKRGAR
ncbi:hypothetical protein ACFL0R_04700 [Pseudomonadota bacterium]